MKPPLTEAPTLDMQTLVHAYIDTIGTIEPDYALSLRPSRRENPFYPSMLIGRGCVMLTSDPGEGVDQRADSLFLQAEEMAAAKLLKAGSPSDEGPLSALQHLARTLLYRADPRTLTYLQADAHQRTVDTITWLQAELQGTSQERSRLVGTLTHQTALGLYTRLQGDAPVFAAFALDHHDQSAKRAQNYDLLVVHQNKNPTDAQPGLTRSTKLQVKTACAGLAIGHTKTTAHFRMNSHSDIAIVSGCCDVHIDQSPQNLIHEHDNPSAPSSIEADERKRQLTEASMCMLAIADGTDSADRYGLIPLSPSGRS